MCSLPQQNHFEDGQKNLRDPEPTEDLEWGVHVNLLNWTVLLTSLNLTSQLRKHE
jgi:hypothetical protein